MARRSVLLLLSCAFVAGCIPASSSQEAPSASSEASGVSARRTRETTIVEVQADVRRRIEAYYRGESEALLPYARRALESEALAGQGTEADLRKALQEDVDRFIALNADLESIAFHEPPKFAQTAERLFVIVPFTLVERNRTTGGRTQVVDFSTGILEKDAAGFYYFEGQIPIDRIREKFPDLPAGYKYPHQSVTPLEGVGSDGDDSA